MTRISPGCHAPEENYIIAIKAAWGRAAGLAVLAAPLFFSGLAFSAPLRPGGDVSDALAANLMGAMLGGLLEYNAMYFGFAFLHGLALVLYGAAFWASGRPSA